MPRFSKIFVFLVFFAIGALCFSSTVFATVPIHERYLKGATAAEARRKLIATAESLLGTRYRFGGINHRGLDCSGLVYLSFKEGLDLEVPRTAESIYLWSARIDSAELQPGDLVFFVTGGSGISHVGIYVGERRFIHSASSGPSTGVIFSRLDEDYWKRTYVGAGRALPRNTEERLLTIGRNEPAQAAGNAPGRSLPEGSVTRKPVWRDPGFFAGFAAAWNWGGFSEGAPSLFRGISVIASAGFKLFSLRAGVDFRPEWDNALGVFRLPITLSVGTDSFQIFGGPAYTFGEARFNLANGYRHYSGGNSWLWEAGISSAFPTVTISRGAISFYGELAWHPYYRENGENIDLRNDLMANLRVSTGLRYMWRI